MDRVVLLFHKLKLLDRVVRNLSCAQREQKRLNFASVDKHDLLVRCQAIYVVRDGEQIVQLLHEDRF